MPADTPNDLVRFNDKAHRADDLRSLTHLWQLTDLDRSRLTLPEDFRWSSPDGTQVQGWLYRAQPNPRRAIIRIHGGPHDARRERNAPRDPVLPLTRLQRAGRQLPAAAQALASPTR